MHATNTPALSLSRERERERERETRVPGRFFALKTSRLSRPSLGEPGVTSSPFFPFSLSLCLSLSFSYSFFALSSGSSTCPGTERSPSSPLFSFLQPRTAFSTRNQRESAFPFSFSLSFFILLFLFLPVNATVHDGGRFYVSRRDRSTILANGRALNALLFLLGRFTDRSR